MIFYFQPITAAVSGGERQKSRGRGKKRKNRRKNNNNSNRRNENNNNKNNRKRGKAGKEEEEEQFERSRQAREVSRNHNNPDFEWDLVNENFTNVKKGTTLNSSEGSAKGDKLDQDASTIKTNVIRKFGKRADNYGGINYTLELGEGEGSPQLQRWRRRLRELLGEGASSIGKEENMVRNQHQFNLIFRIQYRQITREKAVMIINIIDDHNWRILSVLKKDKYQVVWMRMMVT